jgi:hypothetical protein
LPKIGRADLTRIKRLLEPWPFLHETEPSRAQPMLMADAPVLVLRRPGGHRPAEFTPVAQGVTLMPFGPAPTRTLATTFADFTSRTDTEFS